MKGPYFQTLCYLLAMTLGGCATPAAVDYLTLTSPAQAAIRSDAPPVSVGPVTLPEYLKRSALARRDSEGALHYSVSELWAEPLDQGIQRTLIEILSDALEGAGITNFPGPSASRADYGVSISVRRLEATDAIARLSASWRILPTSSVSPGPTLTGRFSREEALVSPSGPAVARAFSALVRALALDIAGAIPAQDP
ncbi:PqiC family protein [Chromatocurvus halotolerans]|uniref:ABC-type transport auxiliary lipoprotein component domain-containing protein n=1 Tax=Chromatocurvus halotolerans TaxID=1132028 RepID=A0A4R2KQE9_9GAMM|nr:PqiC family protein [Chromatocurvus halotolerans]TCO75943.1 hypothetical protein EV688_106134 [Chromatocurvus halotolerans]